MQRAIKTEDSTSFTAVPSFTVSHEHSNHSKQKSYQNPTDNNISIIQIATNMVDSVANMLCRQIKYGILQVQQDQRPLYIKRNNQQKIQQKTIDPQEHKQMIMKFIRSRKRLQKDRQMRSLQLDQNLAKNLQLQQKQRVNSRLKSLQDRRKQITKRMQQKKNMLKEMSKNFFQTNSRIQQIKKKRFLYQDKQQQFAKFFILPKLEQEKKILQKKRQLRNPVNMTELFNHEKKYHKFKIDKQAARSVSQNLIQKKDMSYQAPQYVPKSYRMVQKQQAEKRQQEQLKKKQLQVIQIKKKQYIKNLNQISEKLRYQRKKKKNIQTQKSIKSTPKQKLDRQQTINAGNQYLRQLLQNNRKIAKSHKLKPLNTTILIVETKKPKSQHQLSKQKQQRTKQLQKIRSKKISQILNSSKTDDRYKVQQLQYEIKKLDDYTNHKLKSQQSLQQKNNIAGVMCTAIQAKIGFLNLVNNK